MARPRIPRDLLAVIAALDDPTDVKLLLADLLTASELRSLGERWTIVKRLASGDSQREVRDRVGVSVATVSRGSRQLKSGTGGFQIAFDTLESLDLPHPDPAKASKKRSRR